MVADKINELVSQYSINKTSEVKDDSEFIVLTDVKEHALQIVVHYIRGDLYSIRFLNNDFFELPDQDLITSLKVILEGRYEIRKSFFKQTKSIRIKNENGYIIPERIYDDKEFRKLYENLPKSFTKNI